MSEAINNLYSKTENNGSDDYPVKVSLIVPMYLCEEYVVSLLDNLCSQDYRDIEILCVIDGSPDKTSELVEEYAENDKRIRLITQEHKGAGAARNLGLSEARGKYLMFPDADDEYAPNYVSRLLEAIESGRADIAICQIACLDHSLNRKELYCGYKCILVPKNKAISPSSINHYIDAIHHLPFNKIFRAELIRSNNLKFSETESINDIFFSTAALICANSIVLLEDHLVTYNVHRSTSSISSRRGRYSRDIPTVYRQLYSWLESRGLADEMHSDYCLKWSGTIRDYAKYSDNSDLINYVANELVNEMPWSGMSDKQIRNDSQLYTGATSRALTRVRNKLNNKDISEGRRTSLERAAKSIKREEDFIYELAQTLRDDYSKNVRVNDSYLFARLMQVRQHGLSLTIQTAFRKILNKKHA